MRAENVLAIVTLLEQAGIEFHVDGGWGVDALLGQQTRPHRDLDLAVPHRDVPQLRRVLAAEGFTEIAKDDTWECNLVLGDRRGREIDIHSYVFDGNGNNVFGVGYEPRHLTGRGTVGGHLVNCIPPDVMVEFHRGYELDADDHHDVEALCRAFGLPLPEGHRGAADEDP